jgi:tripartite-type tricarboxylate transporter receptor subunit TctC
VRAPPDGYTLLLVTPANAINATLYERLNYNFIRDIAPVASIAQGPLVLLVHPSFSSQSAPELIVAAKANPDGMTVASAGIGTGQHMSWELFKSMTGIRMVHVPYRGGAPALTDLLGRQVEVYFSTISDAIEHIKAGRLRALAVTSATRIGALPTVPTVGEFVPGFEAVSWSFIVAPRDTPVAVIAVLNTAINTGLADPKVNQSIVDWGETALTISPADCGKLVVNESEKWGKVIREANIKSE